jgi:hypothetical protein
LKIINFQEHFDPTFCCSSLSIHLSHLILVWIIQQNEHKVDKKKIKQFAKLNGTKVTPAKIEVNFKNVNIKMLNYQIWKHLTITSKEVSIKNIREELM